jgi:MFS family permease
MVGTGTSGGVFALSALSARIYPSEMRATGVGFASAAARVGAVLAPLAGSLLLAHGLSVIHVLMCLIIPMILCMILVTGFSGHWRRIED